MNHKKIYVFGNEYLENDNFAGKVAGQLHDVELVYCRSPDELLEAEGDITILDVVKNIKEPMMISDVSRLKVNNMMSLHDFDLGYFLNLMRELDMNKNIKIIGIPMNGIARDVAEKVDLWL
jgi:hypothetical protein